SGHRASASLGYAAATATPGHFRYRRPTALLRVREKLFAYDQPAVGARTLLRKQLRPLLPAPRIVAAGLDAACRSRLSGGDLERLLPLRRREHALASPVLRSDRQSHWRHACQSGPDVDGEFSRGAQSASRS